MERQQIKYISASYTKLPPEIEFAAYIIKHYGFALAIFLMAIMQVWTCVQLINARHDVRRMLGEFNQLAADVDDHDGMLEQLGDEMDTVEGRLGLDREAVQR